ncbi:MAG: Rieske (2Fe-2S) protein [Candidatus Omnitrophica bacterium]|nr:Rieske (2Fe-2S) protein [Candidatus Omnitrophota bacterium]MCB9748028.1 Rieske (2Fe-2S) protein [Candidatus Omnitrophota bacterium]
MVKLFNNSKYLVSSWYALIPSKKLKKREAQSFKLFDRKIALYRGDDNTVRALNARCPHLGTDLGQGCVVGNQLQCAFHHWKFGDDGSCTHIPNSDDIPKFAKTFSYPCQEKFGFIWIFNGENPTFDLPTFEEWKMEELECIALPASKLNCHPHLISSNGLDIEHMKALHNMEFVEEPEVEQFDHYRIQTRFKIAVKGNGFRERIIKATLGKEVTLHLTTWGGNMAVGEAIHKNNPVLIIFAHNPQLDGTSACRGFIFLPKLNRLGLKVNYLKLPQVFAALHYILHADHEILNNIEFHPRLVDSDRPIKLFIDQINKMDYFPREGSKEAV